MRLGSAKQVLALGSFFWAENAGCQYICHKWHVRRSQVGEGQDEWMAMLVEKELHSGRGAMA